MEPTKTTFAYGCLRNKRIPLAKAVQQFHRCYRNVPKN